MISYMTAESLRFFNTMMYIAFLLKGMCISKLFGVKSNFLLTSLGSN